MIEPKLNQSPKMPLKRRPIFIIGVGGIVEFGHLPAYKKAMFDVAGVFDVNPERAKAMANLAGAKAVDSIQAFETLGIADAIYDVAVPGNAVAETLREIPIGSHVLIQKPLGETLEQAREIVAICEARRLNAAVNFQLRWCPYMLGLQDAIHRGLIGESYDIEFRVVVMTPWARWSFLEKAPRMEIVYHSIHYLDFIRHLWGEPTGVKALAISDPSSPNLESTRSTIVLEFRGGAGAVPKRATIHTFHNHLAGPKRQESSLRVEGTKGTAFVQMGLNLNYPKGGDDALEVWQVGQSDWTLIPVEGTWMPDAFIGPMAAMMFWAEGGPAPWTEVHDSFKTMQWVDAAYRSSDKDGQAVDSN